MLEDWAKGSDADRSKLSRRLRRKSRLFLTNAERERRLQTVELRRENEWNSLVSALLVSRSGCCLIKHLRTGTSCIMCVVLSRCWYRARMETIPDFASKHSGGTSNDFIKLGTETSDGLGADECNVLTSERQRELGGLAFHGALVIDPVFITIGDYFYTAASSLGSFRYPRRRFSQKATVGRLEKACQRIRSRY